MRILVEINTCNISFKNVRWKSLHSWILNLFTIFFVQLFFPVLYLLNMKICIFLRKWFSLIILDLFGTGIPFFTSHDSILFGKVIKSLRSTIHTFMYLILFLAFEVNRISNIHCFFFLKRKKKWQKRKTKYLDKEIIWCYSKKTNLQEGNLWEIFNLQHSHCSFSVFFYRFFSITPLCSLNSAVNMIYKLWLHSYFCWFDYMERLLIRILIHSLAIYWTFIVSSVVRSLKW